MKASKRVDELASEILEIQQIPAAERLRIEAVIRNYKQKARDASEERDEALRQSELLASRCDFLVGLRDRTKAKEWAKPKRVKSGRAAAVFLVSDVHCEESVAPHEVNGLNEYSLEICDKSLKQMFSRNLMLTEDARHLVNIREGVLWLGGDMISGHIHDELRERNQLAPLPACRWVSQRLLSGINFLAEHGGFDTLTIATSYGNHGRDSLKNRSAGEGDRSYEHDMYLELRDATSGMKNVKWQIGNGYHNYLDVLGKNCRFHHGHKVKFGGGVGGVTVPLYKAIYAWNQKIRADINFNGHFHDYACPRMDVVLNGSVIGYSPFAIDIKANYQPPMQAFCVIDRDRGLTRSLPVFVR